MTTVNEDIDAIAAEPELELKLESGFPIRVLRIRTRATMSLLKILTRGAGEALATISFSADSSQEAFTGQLLGAVLLAIPEAEDETIEFLNRVVEPANLINKPRLTPGDIEYNQDQWDLLEAELRDPSLDDLVTIVSELFKVEGPHVLALGKRLAALLPVAKKVAKTEPQKKPARRVSASSKSASKE